MPRPSSPRTALLLMAGLVSLTGHALFSAEPDIYCLDGKVIRGIVAVKPHVDTLSCITADGAIGIPYTNLSSALRVKYGYDAFAAGYAHAQHPYPTTPRLSDAFPLSQLEQAKAKAIREGKCLGFILVWGGYFGKQVDPMGLGGDCATAHFCICFRDSLVLVFVRHETELHSVPAAVAAGYGGPDEGGFAPSMAVTDPACTTYICEVPLGGMASNGAIRLGIFKDRIARISAWLKAHPQVAAASVPQVAANDPAAAATTAPTAPADATTTAASDPSSSAASATPVAPPAAPAAEHAASSPATATPSAPSAAAPPTTPAASAPADTPAASATSSAATPASTPTAAGTASTPTTPAQAGSAPGAPAPITYQEVTLSDGRVLHGVLAADRTSIALLNLTTGHTISSMPLDPATITSTSDHELTPPVDPDSSLTPQERTLKTAEHAVVYAIYQLNRAKQVYADTIQEDITWDRTTAHTIPTSQSQSDMLHARLDNLHHRMVTTKAAVPVAQAVVDKDLKTYRDLGGTRDFKPLYREPPQPK